MPQFRHGEDLFPFVPSGEVQSQLQIASEVHPKGGTQRVPAILMGFAHTPLGLAIL